MRKAWLVAARETQEVNIFMPIQKLAMRLQSGAVTPSYDEETTMPLLIRGKKKVLLSQNFDIQFTSSLHPVDLELSRRQSLCLNGKAFYFFKKCTNYNYP